jgi:hypothetical protein
MKNIIQSPALKTVRLRFAAAFVGVTAGFVLSARAQTTVFKEDFNTSGEGTRYTTEGPGAIKAGAQATPGPGPSYWARSADVTAIGEVVGVPFPAPARRAAIVFNHGIDPAFLTADAAKLVDATIAWLTAGKANLRVLFSAPAGAESLGDQYLISRLTAKGHTVTDDDVSAPLPDPANVDLVINSSTGGDPLRLSRYAVPMLSFAGDLIGDLLLATRGLVDSTFDPGNVKIEAAAHPIAAGLPASFKFVTEAQPFDTLGLGIPPASTVVATYQVTNDQGVTSTHPFLVVSEKDAQLLGGLLSGFDGAFWAGADLNEPNIADGTFGTVTEPRSLTFKPINVAGQPKLKLTVRMAATEVDFDLGPDDFLRILADTDGDGPGEYLKLAEFAAPTATDKFFTDGKTRLGVVAKDVTYDIPDGATQLVIRFESNSTFWNEVVGFDDIRVTSGDVVATPLTLTVSRAADELTFTWTGNATLESSTSVTSGWTAVAGATSGHKIKISAATGFFRLRAG